MRSLQQVDAIAHTGLIGDRYADSANRKGQDYQLSLIEIENIEAFRSAIGKPLTLDAPRRNLVTSGVRLNDLNGRRFKIGSVLVEGLELCEPCRLFRARTHPEALEFFVGKGGLRTRIIASGVIAVGDAISDGA